MGSRRPSEVQFCFQEVGIPGSRTYQNYQNLTKNPDSGKKFNV